MRRRSTLRPRSPRRLASHQQLEHSVAQDAGANLQPRSGGYWVRPADVYAPEFLYECKERTARGAKTFTLHKSWLEGVSQQAGEVGRNPVLVFRFKGDDRRWAVLPFEDLLMLSHAAFHPDRQGTSSTS